MPKPKFSNADQLLDFLGELEDRLLLVEADVMALKKNLSKKPKRSFLEGLFDEKEVIPDGE